MRAGSRKQWIATIVVTAFLCGLVLLWPRVSVTAPDFSEDVRWSLQSLPLSVDNLDWRSLDRWYILTQVFDTLVTYDTSQNLISALAAQWHVSSDRLVYTFTLRTDGKFSNGRSVRAADVAYSLKRYVCRQRNSLLVQALRGAITLRSVDDTIPGIAIVNDHVIALKLNFPLENIWAFLAMPFSGGIVDRTSIDPTTLAMQSVFASSGPYNVVFATTDHSRLVANTHHYRFSPQMPMTIGFYRHRDTAQAVKWFLAGRTNFYSVLDPFQKVGLSQLANFPSIAYPYHRIGFLYLNANHPLLQHAGLRRAIRGMLTPLWRDMWRNRMLHWDHSFFPVGSPGHIMPPENVSNVREIVTTNTPLTLLLETGIDTGEIAAMMQRQLARLGITVLCEYVAKREIAERFSRGQFDIGFTTVGLPMVDHSLGLYLYFIENPVYFKDPTGRIHQLFQTITQTRDGVERQALLEAVGQQIAEDAILIPVFHSAVRYVVAPELEVANLTKYRTDIQLANIRMQQGHSETSVTP